MRRQRKAAATNAARRRRDSSGSDRDINRCCVRDGSAGFERRDGRGARRRCSQRCSGGRHHNDCHLNANDYHHSDELTDYLTNHHHCHVFGDIFGDFVCNDVANLDANHQHDWHNDSIDHSHIKRDVHANVHADHKHHAYQHGYIQRHNFPNVLRDNHHYANHKPDLFCYLVANNQSDHHNNGHDIAVHDGDQYANRNTKPEHDAHNQPNHHHHADYHRDINRVWRRL